MDGEDGARARLGVAGVLEQGFNAGRDIDEGQRVAPVGVAGWRGLGVVGALANHAG